MNVLGIAGSLRAKSFNRALLRAAQELAPEGMTICTEGRLVHERTREAVGRLLLALQDWSRRLAVRP